MAVAGQREAPRGIVVARTEACAEVQPGRMVGTCGAGSVGGEVNEYEDEVRKGFYNLGFCEQAIEQIAEIAARAKLGSVNEARAALVLILGYTERVRLKLAK